MLLLHEVHKVAGAQEEAFDAAYRLAADRDIQLRRLNYRRDSLEDIFLKAMDMKEAVSGRL